MKAILISIRPRFVADILNGKKTIEIRKTMPKCDLPIDVYIYCTKSNYFGYISKRYIGKVVAKFTLNKVEEIENCVDILTTKTLDCSQLLKQSCLMYEEIHNYLDADYGYRGYAWHISNLVIFEEPKELIEFSTIVKPYKPTYRLEKAPQSWCYVEAL